MLKFFSRKHWVISGLIKFWAPLYIYIRENELEYFYKKYLKTILPGRDGFEKLESPNFSSFYDTHQNFYKSIDMMALLYSEVYICKIMRDSIYPVVDHYKEHLARQERILVTKDKYGDWDFSHWFQEVNLFYTKKVEAHVIEFFDKEHQLPGYEHLRNKFGYNVIRFTYDEMKEELISLTNSIIEDSIANIAKSYSNTIDNYSNDMNGHEYEHFVSEIINELGYESYVTKGSGDQGVDVIAEVNNYKIAIQCKHYNSKVSNKAIQEIHAAKGIYDCDFALVVSNNDYTKSAREAAAKLDVNLLHHEDIPAFIEWIEENYPAQKTQGESSLLNKHT